MKISTADNNENDAGAARQKSRSEKKMTKRQRRMQGPNPANTWQQQPNIKSQSARVKAYIRDAGLHQSKSNKAVEDLLDPTLDLNSPEVKFGRMLGGTDQRSRHKAVAKLRDYLRARCDIRNVEGGISELDMMKLWKGMWYTLYMADKAPVQDELSKRLAELIWCFAGTEEEDEYAGQLYLDMDEGEREDFGAEERDGRDSDDDSYEVQMEEIENTLDGSESASDDTTSSDEEREGSEDDAVDSDEENEDSEEIDDALLKHCRGAHLASLYVRTFFRTMRREWGNVDKHRVDKFYAAMRLVLAEVYKYMAKRHWNLGIIRLFNDTLFEEVLSQIPNGLRFHLIDISLSELAKANKDADLPLTEATFLDCLEPYFALAQTADDKIVQKRVVENVLTKFLSEYSVVSDNALEKEDDEEDDDNEASELIFREVHVGSVAKFIFEVASDGDTTDGYRAGLYELHKQYQRRIATVGRDVDLQDEDENAALYGGDVDGKLDDDASGSDKNDDSEEEKQEPELPKKTKETPKPKSKSSKKNKKGKRKNSANKDDENVTSEVVDPSEFSTPARSGSGLPKKSSKKKSKACIEDNVDDGDEDEVVNISVKEQKKAASAQKKKRKEKAKKSDVKSTKKRERKMSIEEQEEEARRVRFGAVNHSKSYKASMKDLKTRDLPSTALLTPERSILHKQKRAQSADGKKDSKSKRARAGPATEPRKRRATDYF
eukprot:CAMPEP_0178485580 /NCGR_PEP_ID=MMETSP0696-20121128/8347_1 /TAXON_ID=265572 /ORGANISM="Extubocellulus spinifer, Strain CCMP396" /LENGTH=717 /DNA_ID=CAMNT_0020113181 /DNA_START=215 /DNA_END=2368 /DNA_ORIENTATION=-